VCARETNEDDGDALQRRRTARVRVSARAVRADAGARCDPKQQTRSEVTKQTRLRGLTFDMRRGLKRAKRALGRRLDGRVSRHRRGWRRMQLKPKGTYNAKHCCELRVPGRR